MKKYIRAIICIIFSLLKLGFIKIFRYKNLKFKFITIFSPFTEIDIDKKGKLSLGASIKMKSGSKIRVRNGAEIIIGDKTSMNHNCIFTAHEKIKIGSNVQFGPNVLIYDHDHDFRKRNGLRDLKYKTAEVVIGNNVWIGANVVILRGTTIGDNCVVAAGSVIKGNFESNSIIIQKRNTDVISYGF